MITIKTAELNIKTWEFIPIDKELDSKPVVGYLFEVISIEIPDSELTGADISTPVEETLYLLTDSNEIHSFTITYDNMNRYYGFNEVVTEVYGPPLISYDGQIKKRIITNETSITFNILTKKGYTLGKCVTRDDQKCSKVHHKLVCEILLLCEDSLFEQHALEYYDEDWNEIEKNNEYDESHD